MSLSTVKPVAFTPLNLTSVAPVKLVPEITTLVPETAVAGVKEPTVGAKPVVTTKLVAEVSVPEVAVTEILPVTALAGTVAVIVVSLVTVKLVAGVVPNVTPVAPVNPVPVSVTDEPTVPKAGEKLLMAAAGGPVTVIDAFEVAAPTGVTT